MGLLGRDPVRASGLRFFKMMGSGGGNGFSVLPNLNVYGMLAAWESEAQARVFFREHDVYQAYCEASNEQWTLFMRTAVVHGEWDAEHPFEQQVDYDRDRPVGVLTRATIYPRHLWRFWRFVPSVSRAMSKHHEGLLFSVGVGELPLIQQATFSLWKNSHYMKAYAYQSKQHKQVVKRTREVGWYSEELFARFHPFDSFGSWNGDNPAATVLRKTNS